MFFGSVRVAIDERGTVTLPQRWRAELASGLVLTQSVDRCIYVFPRDKFEAMVNEVDRLGLELADARQWSRYLSGPATEIEIDLTGKIEIPEGLRDFADLHDEASLVGVASRIEIWNLSRRQESESRAAEQMSEIAERVGKIIRRSKTDID